MQTVSMLIKPATGRCNLRCSYCFYEDVAGHRAERDMGLMSEATLERLVRTAMTSAERRVSFAFQGGEPMLRGLPFFERFVQLERQYQKPGLAVERSIQTNGTLVDEAWAGFFAKEHFLVGLSIDGTKDLHDANRLDPAGRGSWNRAVRALALLQKHRVETNLLCVVTGAVARRGQAVYQSLKKLGVGYLQFIPCLDPLGEERGQRPFSLTPARYGQFLKDVFEVWYRDWEQGQYVSVRLFDDYVHLLTGQPAGACATRGDCGQCYVVEGDGSVYPCDFFVLDEWRMGNLNRQDLEELAAAPAAQRFCELGCGHPAACGGCRWLPLCGGGCRRDWVGEERNYYCEALREFFEYAYPRMEHIAGMERRAMADRFER